ncbi:MAG: hypothetical protein M3198_10205 [Actinomycetota bacterium]|nr:hypothetical protein [Actinomycetota bacterium]
MKLVQPQASTPGPINTDPKDLTIWAGPGATLRAIAAGAIKYEPPTSASTSGAIAIHSRYVPWPWATLVDESDEFSSDQIPASIYYENVDRTTAEAAIRKLIRDTYGNTPPSPEDMMVNDFFAGKWIGKWDKDPKEDPILNPLIVKVGADLGTMLKGSVPPPQANTPNAVTLKLRKLDGLTAVDITEIATEAFKECRADLEWARLFETLGNIVFPFTTETVKGQAFLRSVQMRAALDELRYLLESDRLVFQKDLSSFGGDFNQAQLLLSYLSKADSLYNTVRNELADPCKPTSTAYFDLETLWYNVQLIDTYRWLHQVRLYVGWVLIPQAPVPSQLEAWKRVASDLDLKMAQLNTALSEIQSNPNWVGRSELTGKIAVAELSVGVLKDTVLGAKIVRTIGAVAGVVSLYKSMIQGIGAVSNIYQALKNGGGFGYLSLMAAGPSLEVGTVYLANGGTVVIANAGVLVQELLLSKAAGNIIFMAREGKVFNPSGKTPTQARHWVQNRHPNWKEQKPLSGRGLRWVDENGVERIRWKAPAARKRIPGLRRRGEYDWARDKVGSWRLQSRDGHYLDQNGRVVVYRGADGNPKALNGFIRPPREIEVQVRLAPDGKTLANGDPITWANSLDDAERLIHIPASAP